MRGSVRVVSLVLLALLAAGAERGIGAARPLRLFFIDAEGGQSTLIVTPAGQALLIDAGFPGAGTFSSEPGDPAQARDANRIATAAREAGVSRIDFLLITHSHADHIGGVTELARLIPIDTFIDNGGPLPDAEAVAGTLQAFKWYEAARGTKRRIVPKPGDRLPIKDVQVTVVSAAGATLSRPLKGAGERNASCGESGTRAQEPTENPRSVGIRLQFGRFTFLDLGDLTGDPLFALTCPNDMIGPVAVYLVAHHGGQDAADASTFAALRPLTAIVNNGPMKGGTPNLLAALRDLHVDAWQLHHSLLNGAEDLPTERVANLDDSTSNWIRIDAESDGSFAVTNSRTKTPRTYRRGEDNRRPGE